jgi:hypothetical protein
MSHSSMINSIMQVSTHDITVRRPRHDVPFDGNVPVRVQRIVSRCNKNGLADRRLRGQPVDPNRHHEKGTRKSRGDGEELTCDGERGGEGEGQDQHGTPGLHRSLAPQSRGVR